jgi:hypothetical protein
VTDSDMGTSWAMCNLKVARSCGST